MALVDKGIFFSKLVRWRDLLNWHQAQIQPSSFTGHNPWRKGDGKENLALKEPLVKLDPMTLCHEAKFYH